MKILSAEQIRKADKFTIENEPIASIDLMERAAMKCFNWIKNHFDNSCRFNIICGTGNNGGDGLAIARMLNESGYKVTTYIIRANENSSEDFKINEKRLTNLENATYHTVFSTKELSPFDKNEIIIDALFGTGLNKPVTGLAAETIKLINKSESQIISIDMPSGLFADEATVIQDNQIIKSTFTLTFQLNKLAFLFPENSVFFGEVIILPIGLNENFINNCESNYELIEEKNIQRILKKRKLFSHKGNYGHAAIIAGSYGKMGAAVLASQACLRTGAGLLTAIIPECGYEILQTKIPEAMVVCDENEKIITSDFTTDTYSAIGIGPGLGTSEKTAVALKKIIQNFKNPLVIDADAINILAENKTWLDFIPPLSIITPHQKEFERLTKKCVNDFERNKLQIEFAKRYNVYLILKGKYSAIACPDGKCYFNTTGNAGMAKGGSGDTLTGILTGLLAQGYSPKETCLAGVYLHGLAADIAVKETGEYSLLASDIIDSIGKAIIKLAIARKK